MSHKATSAPLDVNVSTSRDDGSVRGEILATSPVNEINAARRRVNTVVSLSRGLIAANTLGGDCQISAAQLDDQNSGCIRHGRMSQGLIGG